MAVPDLIANQYKSQGARLLSFKHSLKHLGALRSSRCSSERADSDSDITISNSTKTICVTPSAKGLTADDSLEDTGSGTDADSRELKDKQDARNGFNNLTWRLADLGVPFEKAYDLDNLLIDCSECFTFILSKIVPKHAELLATENPGPGLLKIHDSQVYYVGQCCESFEKLVSQGRPFEQAVEFAQGEALMKALNGWYSSVRKWLAMDMETIGIGEYFTRTIQCWQLLGSVLKPEVFGG